MDVLPVAGGVVVVGVGDGVLSSSVAELLQLATIASTMQSDSRITRALDKFLFIFLIILSFFLYPRIICEDYGNTFSGDRGQGTGSRHNNS